MNVAIIYSPGWAKYTSIVLYSLFKNNPPPIRVYMVSDSDGYIDLSKLCEYFGQGYEIECVDADPIYNERITSDINLNKTLMTKYVLMRCLVPRLIDKERIVALDTDTIVTGDIKDFHDVDYQGNLFAGVLDIGVSQNHVKNPLGLNKDDAYINAGVTSMNLELIRKTGTHEKWERELSTRCFIGKEQDVMNMTCKDKILLVDNKYNVSISTGLDVVDKRIIHYAGKKPWNDITVPNYEIWEQYVNEYKELLQ